MRDRIRCYSHAKTPEAALSLKERGYTAFKCGGVSDPVRMVAELREAVGDTMDIAIDLHGPPWLTPSDAAQVCRALEPYKLMWVEDPIAPRISRASTAFVSIPPSRSPPASGRRPFSANAS